MRNMRIVALACAAGAFVADTASAQITGQVLGAGAPIVGSTVTLWVPSDSAPRQIAETKSDADGRFELGADALRQVPGVSYLIAKGGEPKAHAGTGSNPAIALLAVLGVNRPTRVVVNEFSTVASVWTSLQFLTGDGMNGHDLGPRIAAANVTNFVDLSTGGWGPAIQDPLNSGQTTTMANFATIANVLSACVTRAAPDACAKLYAAATAPDGSVPDNTLRAAESIAKYPWYKPARLFTAFEDLYPMQKGRILRDTPFNPYLSVAPSAWVLALRFDGGGYRAGGKAMFDSQGNLWVGDNFTIGWQARDALWQGPATKFAPNGRALSPLTTGFTGGGMYGGTFGAAIDAEDNAWFGTYGGRSIAVFDKSGRPLTPPEGITFGHKLGLMQGIIVTPSGDVWALGLSKNQVVYFPKGDRTQGKILCEGRTGDPCHALAGPFHLAIDQQDRIWVSNALGDMVTRFPASNPSQVETFKTGFSGSGLNVDSKGNVWVTNRLGNSAHGRTSFEEVIKVAKSGGNSDEVITRAMSKQTGAPDNGGSVSLLRPDGTPYPGSPFSGRSLSGPWAVVVDGNDNVWISNFAQTSSPLAHLCGVRTETCPPGFKTGDQISPSAGYVSGALQMVTDLAIDPAGNVWMMNNWQNIDSCFGTPPETASTLCGGQGVVVFYGMAKPVKPPQIGPARAP
jgi:streptogramin lyase